MNNNNNTTIKQTTNSDDKFHIKARVTMLEPSIKVVGVFGGGIEWRRREEREVDDGG